jgi:hypothetical protein
MTQSLDDHTPKSERQAYDAVKAMGIDAAQSELDAIHHQADLKMRSFCGEDLENTPHGFTPLNYMSQADNDRRHFLEVGLMLNTPNPAAKAHQRILERSAQRRRARKAA